MRTAGRMAEGGHTDDTINTDARRDEEQPNGSNAHGPPSVEVARQKRAAVRPRVLHVPDKHGPDAKSNRVPRRSR